MSLAGSRALTTTWWPYSCILHITVHHLDVYIAIHKRLKTIKLRSCRHLFTLSVSCPMPTFITCPACMKVDPQRTPHLSKFFMSGAVPCILFSIRNKRRRLTLRLPCVFIFEFFVVFHQCAFLFSCVPSQLNSFSVHTIIFLFLYLQICLNQLLMARNCFRSVFIPRKYALQSSNVSGPNAVNKNLQFLVIASYQFLLY